MTGRLGIDDVRPRILDGNPAKAVVGEIVPVSAVVWREGHDAIAATLNVSGPEDSSVAAEPIQIHMRPTPDNQDQSNAFFVPDVPGNWTFRVDAWSDPMATWRHAITTKIEAGQGSDELYNDFEHGLSCLNVLRRICLKRIGLRFSTSPPLCGVAAMYAHVSPQRSPRVSLTF